MRHQYHPKMGPNIPTDRHALRAVAQRAGRSDAKNAQNDVHCKTMVETNDQSSKHPVPTTSMAAGDQGDAGGASKPALRTSSAPPECKLGMAADYFG